MLSKNQLRYYSSLSQKKFRKQYKRFLAEGEKIVKELIQDPGEWLRPVSLLADREFLRELDLSSSSFTIHEVSEKELNRISSLETANRAIMEFEIPEDLFLPGEVASGPYLFYEDIRDPGNLGTIIRTADWFGIKNIFCSETSVDPFNPKVIQASMGSFARVKVQQVKTGEFLRDLRTSFSGLVKVAAIMEGENLYEKKLPGNSVIFFGNESKGLSAEIKNAADFMITIPSFGNSGAESLNVGISTAIICSELRRGQLPGI